MIVFMRSDISELDELFRLQRLLMSRSGVWAKALPLSCAVVDIKKAWRLTTPFIEGEHPLKPTMQRWQGLVY